MKVTIESIVERWSGLERPLFKGKLIDSEGCKCAQGDVLFCAGYTDEQLRAMEQSKADLETARILGISRTHAVLLRQVNDQQGGCPQLVLSHPEEVIGNKAKTLLDFWLYLDSMTGADWDAVETAARGAAWDAAEIAARGAAPVHAAETAARGAAWDAAETATRGATWDAAWASHEIQGMDILEKDGRQPYFLAFFGFDTWDKVRDIGTRAE